MRQFNTTQPTFRVTAAATRHEPSAMKKMVDLRRPGSVTIPLYKTKPSVSGTLGSICQKTCDTPQERQQY